MGFGFFFMISKLGHFVDPLFTDHLSITTILSGTVRGRYIQVLLYFRDGLLKIPSYHHQGDGWSARKLKLASCSYTAVTFARFNVNTSLYMGCLYCICCMSLRGGQGPDASLKNKYHKFEKTRQCAPTHHE